MRNDESLLNFIQSQVDPVTREARLSAYSISREWKIKKNKITTRVIPVEVTTSRAYVHRLLKKLEEANKIIYHTEGTKTPTIKVL